MAQPNLILSIPQGSLIATSLGIEGFAWHVSPGAGRKFEGRAIYVDLKVQDGKPGFTTLAEGGWRDADGDIATALSACSDGKKRTKTALSNNAFSITPIDAYVGMHLAKTGGQVLPLQAPKDQARYLSHAYEWGKTLSSDDIAALAGTAKPSSRRPRLYMVLAPIEMVILSNLTPEEYGWYSTHRPGKVFRQVLFTELEATGRDLVADSIYDSAVAELAKNPAKKTKTVYPGSAMIRRSYETWLGFNGQGTGGVYVGDRERLTFHAFPSQRPRAWDKAD